MKDSWVIGGLAVASLALMLLLGWQIRDRLWDGSNDFVSFYAGGRLVGTGYLYNAERTRATEHGLTRVLSQAWRYIRLPFHAVFFWPLARLPYRTAYFLWEFLITAAFAGFVCLWRPPSWPLTLLFSSMSFPAFAALMNGQDLTFLLLLVAISVSLSRRGRAFAAGAVLSLCAAKFHLFSLVPVLLVAQKQWRFLRGLLAGGVVLAAISFAAAGPSWPQQFYQALRDQTINPDLGHMPNLHGLFSQFPPVGGLEWIAATAVVAAVYLVARRMSFDYALAATLAGGLLVSYHCYLSDCSLLLPSALTVISATGDWWLRLVAFLLLLPFGYFLLLLNSPLPAPVPLTILLFVFLMALEAWRRPMQPSSAPSHPL
ncbi:MAG TPA: glycosyltransferase family 87 protein [Bryobacterales bacterium]|nr:glycosyltransferase family 87 protein [Bryobacterales bacterium]